MNSAETAAAAAATTTTTSLIKGNFPSSFSSSPEQQLSVTSTSAARVDNITIQDEEGSHPPTARCCDDTEEEVSHSLDEQARCDLVTDREKIDDYYSGSQSCSFYYCCFCAKKKNDNDPSSSSSSSRRRIPIFRGNREALAWCLDVLGRTVAVLSIGAFLMPALLQSAKLAAGCLEEDEECDKTVHGIKPSSLLTLTQTIVSVCASPLLPWMGAIVDYTSHRRLTGRILSALFLSCMFPMIFVSIDTWYALSILLVFLFLIFEFQMVAAYSYLPELTRNEIHLRQFTRNFTTVSFTVVVVYISAIVGITRGALHITDDSVAVAKIALAASFAIAFLTLTTAWAALFQKRPPLHELPPDKTVWTAGFAKLAASIRKITRNDNYRPLLFFYVAIMFGDAALQSLPTILITFFTDQLALDSADIGVAVLLLLLAYIPAGFLSALCTKLFHNNPVYSSIVALLILIIATSTAAAVLSGPGQTTAVYSLVFVWGLGTGWKYTCDRMLSVAIIPQQQSGEFMGLYLFSSIVLTWLPPLIFTLLNEAQISQRIGLATLNAFFLASLVAYGCMGNYRRAIEGTQGVFSQAGAATAAATTAGEATESAPTMDTPAPVIIVEEENDVTVSAIVTANNGGGDRDEAPFDDANC